MNDPARVLRSAASALDDDDRDVAAILARDALEAIEDGDLA